jgi:hypothetical protein
MDLNSPELAKATLASYDAEELKMQQQLASLAEHGPVAAYKVYLKACTKARKQIAFRRRMIEKIARG